MNKVKCTNGHFFDLDKFSCCPICGSGVGGNSRKQVSAIPVEPIRQSQLDNVDKTALLVEDQPAQPVVSGKAGGIKWKFWPKSQTAPEKEPEVEETPVPEQPVIAEPEPEPIPAEQKPAQTPAAEPAVRQQPAGSSLTQAVAATGHGAFSALPKTVAYYDMEETEPPTGWLVCVKGAYKGQAFACKSGRNKIGRNPNCNINLMNEASVTREPHAMIIYDPKQKVFYLQNGTGDGLVYQNGSLLFSHEELKAYDQIQLGNAEFVFVPLCGERFTWDDYIS